MTISMDKKYRTRDGRDVRLLCVDRENNIYSVVGILPDGNIDAWKPDGTSLHDGRLSDNDLIEVRPRIKRDRWVNVYRDSCHLWESREQADTASIEGRIACVKLTIDCEEGEGL